LFKFTPNNLFQDIWGITHNPLETIQVNDATESLATIRGVLEDKPGPARDIVMINAGAAIYSSGIASSLKQGIEKADAAITSGEARSRLDRLVVLTQSFE
ncbi:MAG: hypothetical protein ABW100_07595, partial [Candidatus Thiodiazotropha sp. 6PLUC3]